MIDWFCFKKSSLKKSGFEKVFVKESVVQGEVVKVIWQVIQQIEVVKKVGVVQFGVLVQFCKVVCKLCQWVFKYVGDNVFKSDVFGVDGQNFFCIVMCCSCVFEFVMLVIFGVIGDFVWCKLLFVVFGLW